MGEDNQTPSRSGFIFIQFIIAVLILVIAGGIAFFLIETPPKSEKKEHIKQATTIETQTFKAGYHAAIVEAMGQVIPALQTELKPQISGQIIAVAPEFVPGGFARKDQVILTIDPSNYELEVQAKKATLAQAQATFDLEKGQQAIAQSELKILEQTTGKKLKNTSLALRKPQIAQAKADLDAAKAALDLALLNLERTKIKAPFDGIILERHVNIGDYVSTQSALTTLSGIKEYWIKISVPVEELRWLQLPKAEQKGSKALITDRHNIRRFEGNLYKIIGTLDPQSRLAEILVSLPGPVKDNGKIELEKALLLNDFVNVKLEGYKVSCTLIPRIYARQKNTIWVNENNSLRIKPVSIAFRTEKHVCVSKGINRNDAVITSNITIPVEGMALQTYPNEKQANQP
ncbi:MAG: efflux RND transporter periplasmic adaptor subunit [Alphaproteobacteria bacterium]|nr:efflux RND transporter periplasmic adaptor subunit [Alphaproteobacteria bacterium]